MNKKTIPFDLFTALKIQVGIIKGRFVTRDGYVVQILCWNNCEPFPLIGLCGIEIIKYTLSGTYYTGFESPYDLFMELDVEDEK